MNQIDELLDRLVGQLAVTAAAGDGATRMTAQLDQLLAADQAQADPVTENAREVINATGQSSSTDRSSPLAQVGSIVAKTLSTGLGLAPLISGLAGLFGGHEQAAPPPLAVYAPPQPLRFEGAVQREAGFTDWASPEPAGRGRAVTPVMPQITVQVNAMDSRSFLDHSQDIASAVRRAMLESHSLNDVVSDL